jgi:S-adenosylmethionine-diacylgycerolhomoserine-N-methlytransferase
MTDAASHMDRMYRHQRHFYDATRKFYLLGRDALIRDLRPPSGGGVLEIGCGTARNLVLAARAYPDARFHGVDISEEMLTTARQTLARERLDGRVRVARGDATDFDPEALFGVMNFDRVFISYALSMIPRWQAALDHAARLVATGGSLHIVDFGDFDGLPGLFGLGMRRWLKTFSVTPRLDLDAELSRVCDRRALSRRVEKRFRGYAIHAVARASANCGDDTDGRDARNGKTKAVVGAGRASVAGA